MQARVERVHGQLGGRGVAGGVGQRVLRRAVAAAGALGADLQDSGVLRAEGRGLQVRARRQGGPPAAVQAGAVAGRGRCGGGGGGCAQGGRGAAAAADMRGRGAVEAAAVRQEVVALERGAWRCGGRGAWRAGSGGRGATPDGPCGL